KDKGKGILVEAPKPMKKKDQIEMDAEYARKLQEEIDRDHDSFNKDVDWDDAMDHVNQKSSSNPQYVKRYQGMKKRPQTESEARKIMMIYLKNTAGYKMDFCKGMTYAQICPIFQARFDENIRFLFKSREEMEVEDPEIIKSINETPAQKAAKRRKLSKEAQEAKDLRKRLEVVEDEDDDVFVEATPLAQKVPVVDYQIVLIDNNPRYPLLRFTLEQLVNVARLQVKEESAVTRLQALVDKKKIVIYEAVIHEILQLNDAEGVVCFPNEEIFAGLAQIGTSWNEFSTAMASAVICLSKGQRFNFSKYIFYSLIRNLDRSSKFYMYPHFIQLIIQAQVGDLSTHTTRFISPALTQKVFANMRRVGKGFSGVETPLFEDMIADKQPAEEELGAEQVQVDAAVAADVVEDIAEDVAHVATPLLPPHGILSPPQEPSSPPQQPHVTPLAPTQGEAFPATFQQVLDTCSALLHRVEHFEHENVAQRRLRKVGASRQVESSDDMEDFFNQGRMMNEDEGIELVKDAEIVESEGRQDDKQAEIYNIDLDHSSKVLSMQEDDLEVQDVVEVVTTAKLMTEVVTTTASQGSVASATIPAVSATITAAAPIIVAAYTRRRKGVIIRDLEEELPLKTLETPAETTKVKDKGKGILVEAPKPMKK
nr:hypothetical protein [Tanacetum cinerariifolium]